MRPWVIWMVNHKMAWVVKILVYLSSPIILAMYWREALSDVRYITEAIDYESNKGNE